MNYDLIPLLILPLLIIILIFVLLTKFIYKKTQIKDELINLKPSNIVSNKTTREFISSKQKQIDILMRLNFICDTYFKIATNQNCINIIYPPENPRYFKNETLYSIMIANSLVYFLNSIFSKTYICIKFEFKYLNPNLNQCILTIRSDKIAGNNVNFSKIQNQIIHYVPDNPIYEPLENISVYCKKLNTVCEVSNDRDLQFTINYKIETLSNIIRSKKDPINFDVLIASNETTFEILKQNLEFYGVKVFPNRNSEIVKKHILDTIYTPNAVFLSANIITNSPKYVEILEEKAKFIKFIIILENEQDEIVKNLINFDVFYLNLPFVYETIFSLIDTILKEKEQEKQVLRA